MERKSGIVAFAAFIMLGFVFTAIIVIGDAIVDYWSQRRSEAVAILLTATAILFVAAVIRRRKLTARRRERFAIANQEAVAGLAPEREGSWTVDLRPRGPLTEPGRQQPSGQLPAPRGPRLD